MKRRTFLKHIAVAGVSPALVTRAVRAEPAPNFVFLLTDDWAWPFSSPMRDPRVFPACELANFPVPRTPTLAAMTVSGVSFWKGICAEASCSPSRKSFWTGLTQRELNGVTFATLSNPNGGRRPILVMLAVEANYRTLFLGKSDIGIGQTAMGTDNRLFGHYSGDQATNGEFLIALNEFLAARRSDGLPWAVAWCPKAPHSPSWHLPQYATYDGAAIRAGIQACGHSIDWNNSALANFFASCETMDHWIAEILSLVEAYGFAGNTLVFHSADNGATLAPSKGTLYLTGVGQPMTFMGPMVATHGLHEALAQQVDVYQTVRELGGLVPETTREGRSLVSLLTDPSNSPPRQNQIINRAWPGDVGVRDSRWTYVENRYGAPLRAFEINASDGTPLDILEEDNILPSMPAEERARLSARIAAWKATGL